MPQNVALALIFFFKDMKEIKLKKRLSIKEISHIFGYPRKRVYTLYCFFKYIVQKFHDTRLFKIKFYPHKFFLQDLEELLKKSYDLDYDLVFRLYTLTDLNPNTFTKEIIGYKHVNGARTLLKRLRTRSFTNTSLLRIKQNFLKFREKELISLSNLTKALFLIEKVIHIKSVSLRHGSLEYKFRYNVRNISDIKNSGLRNILSKYLHNIMKGNYPKHIFNNSNIPSGSILYLKGNRNERISFRTIRDRLIKKLEATERMKRHTSGFLNCFAHTTQKVYNEYAQKFGIKPKHEPILSCLIRKRNIIGIEVPVWKQLANNSYFIGHIDLLGVFEDKLIVADYKPTEKEIFRSLPQILAYAYMLKERLGFQNFDKILCVGFSKDVVWSFTPDILENEILQFIEELNSHRTIPLKSRRWKNIKISEIHTDIKKLVV